MRKSLPLVAAAVAVPLLFATVAAFAAGGEPDAPAPSLAPAVELVEDASSTPSEQGTPATVTTTTPPPIRTTLPHAPAAQTADDPEAPVTTTTTTTEVTTPTTPVPPNEWKTPEPVVPSPASPIAPPGPIELTISWDGLKCPRPDAWSVETVSGTKMMCPGSRNP